MRKGSGESRSPEPVVSRPHFQRSYKASFLLQLLLGLHQTPQALNCWIEFPPFEMLIRSLQAYQALRHVPYQSKERKADPNLTTLYNKVYVFCPFRLD